MYVCICNKLSESRVRAAAEDFDGPVESLYESLGAKPRCGRCLETAAEIVQEMSGLQFGVVEASR